MDCKNCGKEFNSYKSRKRILCSRKCADLWRRKKKNYKCKACGKVFEENSCYEKYRKIEHCSKKCRYSYPPKASKEWKPNQCLVCGDACRNKYCSRSCQGTAFREAGNPAWRGVKVTYQALHKWLRQNYGHPKQCEECSRGDIKGLNGQSTIQWANVSGKYKRDRRDWKALCAKCHYHFDKV